MLAFELTMYLRMHTAGHAKDVLQMGMRMPGKGKTPMQDDGYDGDPCFPVVAAFCEAALGTTILDTKQFGDTVRKLQNVGLGTWPKRINSIQDNRE